MSMRLVILDRDGVINHDSDAFIKSADEWLPIDGSIDAIARLSQAGFSVGVASNQSGIGRGLLDRATLAGIHRKMQQLVSSAGGHIDHIVFCPHLPDAGCDCRKPLPGLLQQISQHFGTDLDGVPVVGDSLRDLQAAVAVNARPMLVRTGNGRKTELELQDTQLKARVFDDLSAAVDSMLTEPGGVK